MSATGEVYRAHRYHSYRQSLEIGRMVDGEVTARVRSEVPPQLWHLWEATIDFGYAPHTLDNRYYRIRFGVAKSLAGTISMGATPSNLKTGKGQRLCQT